MKWVRMIKIGGKSEGKQGKAAERWRVDGKGLPSQRSTQQVCCLHSWQCLLPSYLLVGSPLLNHRGDEVCRGLLTINSLILNQHCPASVLASSSWSRCSWIYELMPLLRASSSPFCFHTHRPFESKSEKEVYWRVGYSLSPPAIHIPIGESVLFFSV